MQIALSFAMGMFTMFVGLLVLGRVIARRSPRHSNVQKLGLKERIVTKLETQ